jgi:nucleoside-diphosphate-sugar epimerase
MAVMIPERDHGDVIESTDNGSRHVSVRAAERRRWAARSKTGAAMRVFIAGATGEIGRSVSKLLQDMGASVVGLCRRPENEPVLRRLGVEPRRASLFDEESLVRAIDGCDAVVHAATAIPFGAPRRRSRYAEVDRIRTEGTRCLSRAAGRAGARVYAQQSIVWVAHDPGGKAFDESSPPNGIWWTRSALEGERIAADSASKFGFACATLRCGMFYGPESVHVVAFRRLLRWRLLPVFRDCNALKAFIHIEDAAAAFAAAVRSGRSGLWHAVDDRPVSMNEFLRTLARHCGSPPPFEVPHGLTRLLGDVARSPFLEATVTSNQKLRADLGWSPRFPTIESGFASIVAQWRSA